MSMHDLEHAVLRSDIEDLLTEMVEERMHEDLPENVRNRFDALAARLDITYPAPLYVALRFTMRGHKMTVDQMRYLDAGPIPLTDFVRLFADAIENTALVTD